jgi:hypothetical protein
VTAFDASAGGAIRADGGGAKRELVIKVESKNNWRDRPGVNIRRPRGRNLLPREVQAQQQAEREGRLGGTVETEGPSMEYGLSYAQPQAAAAAHGAVDEKLEQNGDVNMVDAHMVTSDECLTKPPTQDEIALQALIRDSKGDAAGRRSDLVIESTANGDRDDYEARYDETSSFRADVATRPDPASLEAYNAIPVEEFGAALLRGMGWKEGQPIGRSRYGDSAASATQPRIPERRPGFLGIGAKDLSGGKGAEAEIGAWGKAAMRKSSKKNANAEGGGESTDGVYMPVLMKSKKTGEFITEDEFRARQKEVKNRREEEDEWKERRDRNLEKSGRDRDRDRKRGYYDDSEDDKDRRGSRRDGSSRRDRSRSSGDRDRRSRRYDDDDGSDRSYRDRDREKDRLRERDRDRDRKHPDEDRHSSRHSSSTPSRRDYDRERDRDRDRRDRDRDSHWRRDDR